MRPTIAAPPSVDLPGLIGGACDGPGNGPLLAGDLAVVVAAVAVRLMTVVALLALSCTVRPLQRGPRWPSRRRRAALPRARACGLGPAGSTPQAPGPALLPRRPRRPACETTMKTLQNLPPPHPFAARRLRARARPILCSHARRDVPEDIESACHCSAPSGAPPPLEVPTWIIQIEHWLRRPASALLASGRLLSGMAILGAVADVGGM